MLASTGEAPLDSAALAYEPKYDGIRALASVNRGDVCFWSRLGNEKTTQFPEVANALREWGRRLTRPVLIDGEIVALDEHGNPIGFQNLQGRIHLKRGPQPNAAAGQQSPRIAFIAFDLLRDGDEDVRSLPLRDRRARLELALSGVRDPRLRVSEQIAGNGRDLQSRAETQGWEGLIAKRLDSAYKSGRRSPDWRKLKLVRRQACVVAGWTEPRGSRPFFGALLLGMYDEHGRLQYIGHSGAGFSDAELGRVWKQLHALKTKTCPFPIVPRTNERAHWVKPKLVAEVKFTEWTADGKLRHPTYLGLRDDVKPESVRKEPDLVVPAAVASGIRTVASGTRAVASGTRAVASGFSRKDRKDRESPKKPGTTEHKGIRPAHVAAGHQVRLKAAEREPKTALSKAATKKLLDQLDQIEHGNGDGTLQLPEGQRLDVSNLGKVFWPTLKLTKGDLFRHYVRVAPFILPVLADRPLVMKRYPNGVNSKPFYQHRAPDKLPAGVRVEVVRTDTESRSHLIGGSLVTLLYTAQLAAISEDPWFSRVTSPDTIDHIALDLDPPDDLPFGRVLDVARWVREELELLKAPGFPKTSGSGGLHIYVPMQQGTPYEAGLLFAQIVATMVARKHPKAATVERSVAARGRRIYVDYLQNIKSKTLASAYSARANDFAGVSTPLTWDEIDEGVSPKDFTIRTFAKRVEAVGDLWAGLFRSKGADLRAVMDLGTTTKAQGARPFGVRRGRPQAGPRSLVKT
jgi:bifunctional non-homologous end joining protein LigD